MSSYEPIPLPIPNGLDEVGLRLSLFRLPNETLAGYRLRLLDQIRNSSGPTERDLLRTLGRRVGKLNQRVLEVDLILSAGEPVAPDPYVEITSNVFRAYSDYENLTLDAEVIFRDERWLRDIEDSLAASTFFTTSRFEGYDDFLDSRHLLVSNTSRFYDGMYLRPSKENKLNHSYIVDIWSNVAGLLSEEMATRALVVDPGQYHIDRTNGVLYTEDTSRGFVTYTYREFPFTIWWQEVRAAPLNDADWQYALYDTELNDDTGLPDEVVLNGTGARYYNQILQQFGLEWGA